MNHTRLIALIGVSMLPTAVLAQAFNPEYPISMVNEIGIIVSLSVPMLVALALALFIWGLVMFISKTGDENAHEEGRRKMVWGILALFVIVSVWGLVVLLRTMVGLRGADPAVAPPQATFGGGGSGSGGGPGAPGGPGSPPPCDDVPGNSIPECPF